MTVIQNPFHNSRLITLSFELNIVILNAKEDVNPKCITYVHDSPTSVYRIS